MRASATIANIALRRGRVLAGSRAAQSCGTARRVRTKRSLSTSTRSSVSRSGYRRKQPQFLFAVKGDGCKRTLRKFYDAHCVKSFKCYAAAQQAGLGVSAAYRSLNATPRNADFIKMAYVMHVSGPDLKDSTRETIRRHALQIYAADATFNFVMAYVFSESPRP